MPLDSTGSTSFRVDAKRDLLEEDFDLDLAKASVMTDKWENDCTMKRGRSALPRAMQMRRSPPQVREMVQSFSHKAMDTGESLSRKHRSPSLPIMEVHRSPSPRTMEMSRSPSPRIMDMVQKYSTKTQEVTRLPVPKLSRTFLKATRTSESSTMPTSVGSSRVTFASQHSVGKAKEVPSEGASSFMHPNNAPPGEPGAQNSEVPDISRVKPQIVDMKREGAVQAFKPKHLSLRPESNVSSSDIYHETAEHAASASRCGSSLKGKGKGKFNAPGTSSLAVPMNMVKQCTMPESAEASAARRMRQRQQQHWSKTRLGGVWARGGVGNVNEATQTPLPLEDHDQGSSTFESSTCPSTTSAVLLVLTNDCYAAMSDLEHSSSGSGSKVAHCFSEACSDGLSHHEPYWSTPGNSCYDGDVSVACSTTCSVDHGLLELSDYKSGIEARAMALDVSMTKGDQKSGGDRLDQLGSDPVASGEPKAWTHYDEATQTSSPSSVAVNLAGTKPKASWIGYDEATQTSNHSIVGLMDMISSTVSADPWRESQPSEYTTTMSQSDTKIQSKNATTAGKIGKQLKFKADVHKGSQDSSSTTTGQTDVETQSSGTTTEQTRTSTHTSTSRSRSSDADDSSSVQPDSDSRSAGLQESSAGSNATAAFRTTGSSLHVDSRTSSFQSMEVSELSDDDESPISSSIDLNESATSGDHNESARESSSRSRSRASTFTSRDSSTGSRRHKHRLASASSRRGKKKDKGGEGHSKAEGGDEKKKKKKKKKDKGDKDKDEKKSEAGGAEKTADGDKTATGEKKKKKKKDKDKNKEEKSGGDQASEGEEDGGAKKKKKKKDKEEEKTDDKPADGADAGEEGGKKKKKKKKDKEGEKTEDKKHDGAEKPGEAEAGEEGGKKKKKKKKKDKSKEEEKTEEKTDAAAPGEEGGKKKKLKDKGPDGSHTGEKSAELSDGGNKDTGGGGEKGGKKGSKEADAEEGGKKEKKGDAGKEGGTSADVAGHKERSGALTDKSHTEHPVHTTTDVATDLESSTSGTSVAATSTAASDGAVAGKHGPGKSHLKGHRGHETVTATSSETSGVTEPQQGESEISFGTSSKSKGMTEGYASGDTPTTDSPSDARSSSPASHKGGSCISRTTSASENEERVYEMPYGLGTGDPWPPEPNTKIDHFEGHPQLSQLCPKCISALKGQITAATTHEGATSNKPLFVTQKYKVVPIEDLKYVYDAEGNERGVVMVDGGPGFSLDLSKPCATEAAQQPPQPVSKSPQAASEPLKKSTPSRSEMQQPSRPKPSEHVPGGSRPKPTEHVPGGSRPKPSEHVPGGSQPKPSESVSGGSQPRGSAPAGTKSPKSSAAAGQSGFVRGQ